MSVTYRSRWRPPLAVGGHAFVMVNAGSTGTDLFSGDERPSWWRCLRCHWQGPRWMVTEKLYPLCGARFRALLSGPDDS